MERPASPHQLKDLISSETTPHEFESAICQFISDDEKGVLKDNILDKVARATLSTCSFAPNPGTFDRDAFRYICCVDDKDHLLPDDQTDTLLNFCLRTGIFTIADMKKLRFSIVDTQLQTNLGLIAEKYESF